MDQPLNLTSANVMTPDGPLEKVSVVARPGTGKVRVTKGLQQLHVRDDVTSVARLKGRQPTWRITFADGAAWDVVRTKAGCRSCGG